MEGGIMKELISIIVPVYKVEKYIHRCIESALAQTYRNWELILVDDGSPDGCGSICDSYASKDFRIHVIHKKNGGLSSARNAGLQICQGDYITFLDSDDYLMPNALEDLIQTSVSQKADLVMGVNLLLRTDGSLQQDTWATQYGNRDISSQELRRAFLRDSLPNYAWGKLYHASLLSHLRFPEGQNMEDLWIMPHLVDSAKKMVILMKDVYVYSQENSESILHAGKEKSVNTRYCQFLAFLEHIKVAQKVDKTDLPIIIKRTSHVAIRAYLMNRQYPCLLDKEKSEIRNFLAKYSKYSLSPGLLVKRFLIIHGFL